MSIKDIGILIYSIFQNMEQIPFCNHIEAWLKFKVLKIRCKKILAHALELPIPNTNTQVMIKVKTYNNTILVSFEESKLQENKTADFKNQFLKKLTSPYSNLMIDFSGVNEIDQDMINALIAGQRLSSMNKCQVSLFNVKEEVYKTLFEAKVDHLFFFCDLPKPFSQNLLIA